jgi:hypothetical protein
MGVSLGKLCCITMHGECRRWTLERFLALYCVTMIRWGKQLGLARIAHRPSSGRGGWAEFQFTVQRLGSLPGAGKGMKMISRGIAPVVGSKSNIHSIFCLVRKICPKQGCGEPILIPMGLVRGRRMAFTMNVLLSPAACSERCSTPQHTLSRPLSSSVFLACMLCR